MGMPKVIVSFKSVGVSAIARGSRGIVALILKDAAASGFISMDSPTDVPAGLSNASKLQIALAWLGYTKPPMSVVAYILPDDATDYTEALAYLESVKFDYISFPADATSELKTAASTWIKHCRANLDKLVAAVLPNFVGDHEGIINFATDDIVVGAETYSAAEYCARIAGLLAGTPMTISATYAPLPEVSDVPHLTRAAMDAAVDAGKAILMYDGDKVKLVRAVNSLTTVSAEKGADFQKVKILAILDMIATDIHKTANDVFVGKYANSYDNKCLLVAAIQGYYAQLELDGLLDKGKNSIDIDVEAQRAYLKGIGVKVETMSDLQIKQANTNDKVFLVSSITPLDAIEEITLAIAV